MKFEDYFSKLAQGYARYRPSYPQALFAYLASISPNRKLAWDCGTGNGQAALSLVEYFDQVVATDASSDQLAQAFQHPKIAYRTEPAEKSSLATGSASLVTVAIAVHWFDLDQFYREVRRVLQSGGVIAVWTYHLPVIDPAIDAQVVKYYAEVLAGYWPPKFHFVDERYQTLPFPFEELQPPPFEMSADWDLGQLVGFLNSWTAAHKYEGEHGQNPIKRIWQELSEAWGEPQQRRHIRWPLFLRVGITSPDQKNAISGTLEIK